VTELLPHQVRDHLRKNGITVHLATYQVPAPHRIQIVLEGGLGEYQEAEDLTLELPGVRSVQWVDRAHTILLITPHPDVAGT
jgi:hypothetical protein